ncbi:hydroxyethylthiazole kinase [Salinicoccus sesuvii]|uniref:Hydroxyethylthiazole kinase n=1 Tax=Salinicoccus sesuvii TaxID=868281 RepID=A0ABV7N4Q8_9STAP
MKRIEKLRTESPLVVCITNDVVKNFTANGMLAIGASPIMSGEISEAEDLMNVASALVVNIGTADHAKVALMHGIMSAANEKGKPIIFDPVGYGASSFRVNTTEDLLSRHEVSLIKGNGGEMLALSGAKSSLKGVDSTEQTDTAEIAKAVYNRFNVPALVTGKVDALATEDGVITMFNGHSLQGKITGSGCLLGALTAAFIGIEDDFSAEAVVDAVSYYNLCAECAAAQMNRPAPGNFISHLIDELYLSEDALLLDRNVKGL